MSWEHMPHGQLQLHQRVPSLIYFFFLVPCHQSIWWIYLCLTYYSSGKGLGMGWGWTQSFAPCCQKHYLAIASLSLASLQYVAHINLKEDISKCQGWSGTWNTMYTCQITIKIIWDEQDFTTSSIRVKMMTLWSLSEIIRLLVQKHQYTN